jgi:hypothetical protein
MTLPLFKAIPLGHNISFWVYHPSRISLPDIAGNFAFQPDINGPLKIFINPSHKNSLQNQIIEIDYFVT